MQLRPFLLDLLAEQIVGYYDPGTKVLYVVKGADPMMASVTVSHELVHALFAAGRAQSAGRYLY